MRVATMTEPAKTETNCPCGCDGEINAHDDRAYGAWSCPLCDDESDTDLGELCSQCERAEKSRA